MTKQEFISRQKAMTREGNKRMAGWLVLFFGVIFSGIPFSRYVERHEELTWIGPVFGIGLFAFLVSNLVLLVWFGKRQQKRYGILCSNCGKPVIGFNVQIAIATGNCGNCGEKLFTETEVAQRTPTPN